MKTNVAITLTDEQRSHLANLLDGKPSKRLATRAEVNALVNAFVQALEELNIDDVDPGPGDRAELVTGAVIEDINRGGWTLIGEPPGLA